MGFSKVISANTFFLKGKKVLVEVDTSLGLNQFSIVGLGDKAIDEARDRVGSALRNIGYQSPKHSNIKTIVSLAPANIKKEGAYFDMAIAIGFLVAEKILPEVKDDTAFIGELGLNGDVRSVSGMLPILYELKKQGITKVFIPKDNKEEAAHIDELDIYPVSNLSEVVSHIKGETMCMTCQNNHFTKTEKQILYDFSDIKEQQTAKRALQIAAAGRHNIGLYGPPGTGKTMLAKAFAEILPQLEKDDTLEVTSIHSIAGTLPENGLIETPPFRSPHHTASYVSLIGGGTNIRPGEVTLAHKGVLFLDEFTEFDKKVLESLRQPLEDRVVSIARAKGSVLYPSDFILVSAMNPCPCGYKGSKVKPCTCTTIEKERYKRKLSGPILDRIDMWVYVGEIDYAKLHTNNESKGETQNIRERVLKARNIMKERSLKLHIKECENSRISAKNISKVAPLSEDCELLLRQSAEKLGLSARAYHRIIKVARTIADLEHIEHIEPKHILEALSYRPSF